MHSCPTCHVLGTRVPVHASCLRVLERVRTCLKALRTAGEKCSASCEARSSVAKSEFWNTAGRKSSTGF